MAQTLVRAGGSPIGLRVDEGDTEVQLLGLATNRSRLVRRLLQMEHGRLLGSWGELRGCYGREEIEELLELAVGPASEGLEALEPLSAQSREALWVLLAGIDALGCAPRELAEYLSTQEADHAD